MYPSLRKSLHERIKPEEKGSAGSALFSIKSYIFNHDVGESKHRRKAKNRECIMVILGRIFISGRCFFLKKNPAIYVD